MRRTWTSSDPGVARRNRSSMSPPPDVLEGVTIINFYYTGIDEPAGQRYHDIVEQYAPGTDGSGTNASGYVSLLGLVLATADLEGDITPDTVMQALQTSHDVPSPLTADAEFSCDGSLMPEYPSACSASYSVSTLDRDGNERYVYPPGDAMTCSADGFAST